MTRHKFKFIDLFAGIGGFNQAMTNLGGKCVLACEIDEKCIEVYKNNYNDVKIINDVRKLNKTNKTKIPKFDVLCAGFPCQPFSKAGAQRGFNDENRGDLFYEIIRILKLHPEVKYLILENVRNLADKKENWEIIKSELTGVGFIITEDPIILSPTNFGIPQIRERVFILGIRKDLIDKEKLKNECIQIDDLDLGDNYRKNNCNIGDAFKILEENVSDEYLVTPEIENLINIWDEFRINSNLQVAGFPIWLHFMGIGIDDDAEFKESVSFDTMPSWKQSYVTRNRNHYLKNRQFIDKWVSENNMMERNLLHKKFEWNCGGKCNDMHNAIIQIRQSGVRVKLSNCFPSLVAMINTPIIWDKRKEHYRYITPREAANLQSFNKTFIFSEIDKRTYKQLGNSVNVKIIEILGERLFQLAKPKRRVTK